MSAMSGESLTVLRRFVAGTNAQLRKAGRAEYQMRVARDGSITVPKMPKPGSRPAASGAKEATAGAKAIGAAGAAGAAAPGAIHRTGAAPAISDLQRGADRGFRLAWAPTQGATAYGIWQDGSLLGHVTNPAFAGQLAETGSSVIQIDAVRADGSRSQLTKPLRAGVDASGGVTFAVDGMEAAPPAGAAAAPAAQAAPAAPATAAPAQEAAPVSPAAAAAPVPAAAPVAAVATPA